jgi:nitrile hydratase
MAALPLFAAGDRVRTRRTNPTGHTRLPRYARDCVGMIEAVHGGFVCPDTNAHGAGEAQEYVYTVAFTGEELWGETANSGLTVSIDAWESYLVPA